MSTAGPGPARAVFPNGLTRPNETGVRANMLDTDSEIRSPRSHRILRRPGGQTIRGAHIGQDQEETRCPK